MMPNWTFLALHFVHTMALAVWVGGIVAIGALTAPCVFGLASSRSEAGRIMASIFQRFDVVVLGCAVALVATSVAYVTMFDRLSPWYAIEYVCIGMMSASALYSARVLSPRIRHLRAEGRADGADFDRLHRLSVLSMRFNLACGTLAIAFS